MFKLGIVEGAKVEGSSALFLTGQTCFCGWPSITPMIKAFVACFPATSVNNNWIFYLEIAGERGFTDEWDSCDNLLFELWLWL